MATGVMKVTNTAATDSASAFTIQERAVGVSAIVSFKNIASTPHHSLKRIFWNYFKGAENKAENIIMLLHNSVMVCALVIAGSSG